MVTAAMQNRLFGAAEHDPGGKVRIALAAGMRGAALYGGATRQYRYRLERVWDETRPAVMFVMMNPSTAVETANDPTVAKCCRYAQAWSYGRLLVGNTFAYRATDQRALRTVDDPVGPENDRHLLAMAQEAALTVFAYGKPHPSLRERGPAVAAMLVSAGIVPHALQLCADGTPGHPLYLKGDLRPIRWNPKGE